MIETAPDLEIALPGVWETRAASLNEPWAQGLAMAHGDLAIADRIMHRLYTECPTALLVLWLRRPETLGPIGLLNEIKTAQPPGSVIGDLEHAVGYPGLSSMRHDLAANRIETTFWLANPESEFALALAFVIEGPQALEQCEAYAVSARRATWRDLA